MQNLPSSLATLEEALRGVQKELEGVVQTGDNYKSLSDLGPKPLTVKLIQEARLKHELLLADRKKEREAKRRAKLFTKDGKPRRKKDHYTQKRAKANGKQIYRGNVFSRYSRWTRRQRTKREGIEMTKEEFAFIWGRIHPWTGKPLFMTKQFVRWKRLDVTQPWRLDNIHPQIQIGKRTVQWRELELPSEYSSIVFAK